MEIITLILSIEIGIIVGLGLGELVKRVNAKRNLARFEAMVTEAVRDGLAQAFTPTEEEYAAYINGDTGERYTEEELEEIENGLSIWEEAQIEDLLLEKGEK